MTSPSEQSDAVGHESSPGSGLGRRALLNSAQLGGSLMISWVMSLIGRFLLPRLLGTDVYGQLTLVESVATLALSLMAFGINDHISKEVSTQPSLALGFARPVQRLQLFSGVALTAAMTTAFFFASGGEVALVALAFGAAQIALVLGKMNAAYLQARHEAAVVSKSAIVTKALWLVLLLAILGAGVELLALPVALLVSETVRTAWLHREFRRQYGEPVDAPISRAVAVVKSSAPFYLNALNVDFMAYSVRIIVGVIGGTVAVGLFGAALVAASVPLLLTPVLGWVAIPVFSTMRQQGGERMWAQVGSMIDVLAVTVVGSSIVLFALSDSIIPVLFGSDYVVAGPAFAFLMVSVPATYFTQIVGSAFIADNRSWQNTSVNIYTMLLVLIGVIVVLFVDGTSDPARVAWLSAIVVAAGEWVTVAALVVVRPFKVAGRATMFRLLAMAVAVSVSASEKLGADSLGLRWAAAGLALVVLLSDLPNVIRKGRELLRPGAEPASPADR